MTKPNLLQVAYLCYYEEGSFFFICYYEGKLKKSKDILIA